jgi:Ca2+-binding RTX toxin-like protein
MEQLSGAQAEATIEPADFAIDGDSSGVATPALPGRTDADAGPVPVQSSPLGEAVSVLNVSGDVTVISVDGRQGAATPGQQLGPGDVLMTQGNGALELALADGTRVFFDSESRILIEEPPQPLGKPQFFVIQGEFSVTSASTPDAPASELMIRTPVATVTVRGARMIGKAAPEAQANTFVLLPGVAGAAAGSIAVATSGAPVVIDQPLQGLQVLSLFRDPTLLPEVDAGILNAEFGTGVLAYSEVGDISELADAGDPGVFSRLGELFGVTEAQAEPLLVPTRGLLDGDDGVLGAGDDDDLADEIDDDNDDDEIVNVGDDDNDNVLNVVGDQDIDIAGGDFFINGAGDNDQVNITADQNDANTVTFATVDGQAVLTFAGGTNSTVTLNQVETVQVDLGVQSDAIAIGNLVGSGISDDTVILNLNAGDDVVNAADAGVSLVVDGGAGDDSVVSSSSDDVLTGGAGNDTLTGNGDADTLSGGAGDDSLTGGSGSDSIDGGDGVDTAEFSDLAQAVDIDLAAGTASDGTDTDTLVGIENVIGSAQDDTLAGDAADNLLNGGDGTDTADFSASGAGIVASLFDGTAAGDGDDTLADIENLIGSANTDLLEGDNLANLIQGGAGGDTIEAGSGDDTLAGGDGDDSLDGGADADTADFSGSAAAVTVDLANGTATGEGNDTLTDIEAVTGSANADTLTGSAAGDTLDGGAGDDLLTGAAGADSLVGGDGTDTADFSDLAQAVTVDLAAGTASDGTDTDTLSGVENVTGTAQADALTGDDVANVLSGGAGTDTLSGAGGDDVLNGEAGNDRLAGGEGDDTLDGGDGIDTADFGAAAAGVAVDLAGGTATGEGTDQLISIERVEGSAQADSITGDDDANTLSGAAGDDTLIGAGGDDRFGYASIQNDNDTIFGGDGTDELRLDLLDGDGSAVSIADDGNGDVLVDMTVPLVQTALLDGVELIDVAGVEGDDTLTIGDLSGTEIGAGGLTAALGDGADVVDATQATVAFDVDAGAGADTVGSGAGDDTLAGGDGLDVLDLSAVTAVLTVDIPGGTATSNQTGTDQISGFETVLGGSGDDSLRGDGEDNSLSGGAGDDTLAGGDGDDTLDGGDGADTADFTLAIQAVDVDLDAGTATGQGADQLNAIEAVIGSVFADSLVGGIGDETFTGAAGDDTLDGGDGVDTADYSGEALGVNIDLGNNSGLDGSGDIDTLLNIENIVGSARADTLTGDGLDNSIDGGIGGDRIEGGDGADTLFGNNGGDTLIGGLGDDSFDGGVGTDTADFTASAAAVDVDLSGVQGVASGEGNDTLTSIEVVLGSGGNDTIVGSDGQSENLQGRGGNDSLSGLDGSDTLIGAAGEDTLDGGDGDDLLSGGNDDDTLVGGDGADTLDGESGADLLTGGAGSDAFFYDSAENHQDVITDFVAGGTDRFLIDGAAFGNIATDGNSNLIDDQSFFSVGQSLAVDGDVDLGNAEASFVFDSAGTLHFDPDGGDTSNSFEIATVTVTGTLTGGDFEVQ